MIKANELRIGNWIFELENVKVESINKDGINIDGNGAPYPFDMLCGIPLTREILEKCGFVENKRRLGEWNDKDWFEIHKEEDGYAVFASEWTLGKPFQYLHQLQNLYFALTEKELSVNL